MTGMPQSDPGVVYFGTYTAISLHLADEVADVDGSETCHVCESSATYLARLSQDPSGDNDVELGQAVHLCSECHPFVEAHDPEALAQRFSEKPFRDDVRSGRSRLLEVASRITDGTIESAQISR